jgi:hypothetical protein
MRAELNTRDMRAEVSSQVEHARNESEYNKHFDRLRTKT